MNEQPKENDELDVLFERLRNRDIPTGPSAELISRTSEQLDVLSNVSRALPRSKRELVMQRLGIVGGSLAMAGLFAMALLLAPDFGGITFAEVRAALASVKSIQYTETRLDGPSQNQADSGVTGESTTPPQLVNAKGEELSRVFISGRYQKRTEHLDRDEKPYAVEVIDMSTGKTASLLVPEKRYSLLTTQVTLHQDGTKEEHDITTPNLAVDFYSEMAKVPDDAVTELPEKSIAGKTVVGFLVTRQHGNETWTRTYWIDATTRLPVQVEINFSSTNPMMAPSTWIQSDFVYGEELDPALFSTALPVGYHVSSSKDSQKIYGLKVD